MSVCSRTDARGGSRHAGLEDDQPSAAEDVLKGDRGRRPAGRRSMRRKRSASAGGRGHATTWACREFRRWCAAGWSRSKTAASWRAGLVPTHEDLEGEPRSGLRRQKKRVCALYRVAPPNGRVICFDEFGPIEVRPYHGRAWRKVRHPARLRATTAPWHAPIPRGLRRRFRLDALLPAPREVRWHKRASTSTPQSDEVRAADHNVTPADHRIDRSDSLRYFEAHSRRAISTTGINGSSAAGFSTSYTLT